MKRANWEAVKVQSFVAALYERPDAKRIISRFPDYSFVHVSHDECLHIAFVLRGCNTVASERLMADRKCLILGDDAECRDSSLEMPVANAVAIEFDIAHSYLNVTSSIVGLPPIFVYRDSEKIVLASDLYLLRSVHDVDLHVNPHSILETCRIGYPINGKTLFSEVEMLPTGSSFTWSGGHAVVKKIWNYADYAQQHVVGSGLDQLECSFKKAMASIDISRSFLSLTGGLDTRTILALLVANGSYIPAYTITGSRLNLDAKISSNLSKVYGINHELVVLDGSFTKDLPNYVVEASRLSGGLCSLAEAHEVYFYSAINKDLESRLSGNLGNQLGRQGTEQVSMRNASKAVLNKELILPEKAQDTDWHSGFMIENDRTSMLGFLLENEVRSSSVANYCIGSHYAIQQTPYANRSFIEDVLGASNDNDLNSRRSLRLRDLLHRFIGQKAAKSFQVRIIDQTGGYVSACPINWGWTVNGWVSISGRVDGCLAFLDAALTRYFPTALSKRGPAAFFVTGMNNFKHTEYWLRSYLRDFVFDELSSSSTVNSGLFNYPYLAKVLEEHYSSGQNHTREIQLALDLALARKIFNAGLQ